MGRPGDPWQVHVAVNASGGEEEEKGGGFLGPLLNGRGGHHFQIRPIIK